MYQRLCSILECHCSPDAPEVLRVACAEALCVAGVPLISHSLREHSTLYAIMIRYDWSQIVLSINWCTMMNRHETYWMFSFRLINTGLYLLQDQSQEVRMRAACLASMLHNVRRSERKSGVYFMQVNQALLVLLDLLLEECWAVPSTLGVLLCHLPQSDLRSVLRETSETGYTISLSTLLQTEQQWLSASLLLLLSRSDVPVCMNRTRPMCLPSLLWCLHTCCRTC